MFIDDQVWCVYQRWRSFHSLLRSSAVPAVWVAECGWLGSLVGLVGLVGLVVPQVIRLPLSKSGLSCETIQAGMLQTDSGFTKQPSWHEMVFSSTASTLGMALVQINVSTSTSTLRLARTQIWLACCSVTK